VRLVGYLKKKSITMHCNMTVKLNNAIADAGGMNGELEKCKQNFGGET
jgi:hypothetical protein